VIKVSGGRPAAKNAEEIEGDGGWRIGNSLKDSNMKGAGL